MGHHEFIRLRFMIFFTNCFKLYSSVRLLLLAKKFNKICQYQPFLYFSLSAFKVPPIAASSTPRASTCTL